MESKDKRREMLGSGTTTQVIKGPGRPLNSHAFNTPNCPAHLPREPRQSQATPREGEPFSLTVYAPFNHDNGIM
jgi:hypothetical protein